MDQVLKIGVHLESDCPATAVAGMLKCIIRPMRILAAAILILAPAIAMAQQVIPQPVLMTRGTGVFTVTGRTAIWTDPGSAAAGRQLARYLEPATGFSLRVVTGGVVPPRSIVLRTDPTLKRLGREGYLLEVKPSGVVIRAPQAAGLVYAMQTMRQLLPAAIFREGRVEGVRWAVPSVVIK